MAAEDYGKPFFREKARVLLLRHVQTRLHPDSIAEDILRNMLEEFLSKLDMASYAPHLDFSLSYTTLHDHHLGAEVLSQTDIEQRFKSFAGAGSFASFVGGTDGALSGAALEHISDGVAASMESLVKAGSYRPALIRSVSTKLKSTEWWEETGTRCRRICRKTGKS